MSTNKILFALIVLSSVLMFFVLMLYVLFNILLKKSASCYSLFSNSLKHPLIKLMSLLKLLHFPRFLHKLNCRIMIVVLKTNSPYKVLYINQLNKSFSRA